MAGKYIVCAMVRIASLGQKWVGEVSFGKIHSAILLPPTSLKNEIINNYFCIVDFKILPISAFDWCLLF